MFIKDRLHTTLIKLHNQDKKNSCYSYVKPSQNVIKEFCKKCYVFLLYYFFYITTVFVTTIIDFTVRTERRGYIL